MKVYCLILFLSTFCCACLRAQSTQTDCRQSRGRDPLANGLKSLERQKKLLDGNTFSLSGNFTYRRNILPAGEENLIQRSSSYSLPVVLGRRLSQDWVLEAGPFVGINRHAFQRPDMLKEDVAPQPTQTELAYGLLFGISHRLSDLLSLQLRYRKDFGSGSQAWQPIQLGWSLTF